MENVLIPPFLVTVKKPPDLLRSFHQGLLVFQVVGQKGRGQHRHLAGSPRKNCGRFGAAFTGELTTDFSMDWLEKLPENPMILMGKSKGFRLRFSPKKPKPLRFGAAKISGKKWGHFGILGCKK